MLDVVSVDARDLETFEQLGSKDKFWYDDRKYLFKARRPETGEDWAEVVAAQIADRIGLPHARYDLAEAINLPAAGPEEGARESRGVRSLNFTPWDGRLVVGNELIGPSPSESAARAVKAAQRRSFHTPSRIYGLLVRMSFLELPIDWQSPDELMTPIGVMAGYLMFDVLIANQDRHEENWGFVTCNNHVYLAPTFDHASSLGRELRDEKRAGKLRSVAEEHGVAGYASKARSQMHDKKTGERLSTVAAFLEFGAFCQEASRYWLSQLGGLDEEYFRRLFSEIPDTHITDVGREFAIRLLMENKKRLLALKL
ncbi:MULTISPECIES: hypothetical protein [Stenotrophomonas maltophilia group]|uniref:hypothetical protein n=1 Tax=Stenotrophomonas TaxID=40323 RepID=UPI0021CAAD50|nr:MULTISPECIES: hypothetical protein [Stenotrophomonas maltophilia group]MCU1052964.1 hypothetical protein [Stenotrophomonas maltophilia]